MSHSRVCISHSRVYMSQSRVCIGQSRVWRSESRVCIGQSQSRVCVSESRVSILSIMSGANHTRTTHAPHTRACIHNARKHARTLPKKKSEEVRELLKKDKLPFFEVFVQVPLHIAEVRA